MKANGANDRKPQKAKAIISDREVQRFVRAEVALVRWKRLRKKWPVKLCAGWGGVCARTWWNAEHDRRFPGARTLARMWVGVNLTIEEVLTTLERRKIRRQVALAAAASNSSANTNSVATLETPAADAGLEAQRQKINELILALRR